jgi:hypothetical protein
MHCLFFCLSFQSRRCGLLLLLLSLSLSQSWNSDAQHAELKFRCCAASFSVSGSPDSRTGRFAYVIPAQNTERERQERGAKPVMEIWDTPLLHRHCSIVLVRLSAKKVLLVSCHSNSRKNGAAANTQRRHSRKQLQIGVKFVAT